MTESTDIEQAAAPETLRTEIKLCHLDELTQRVAKINAKISRAAAKHGQAAVDARVISVPGTERTVYRCSLCHAQRDERPARLEECSGPGALYHLWHAVPVVTVELSLARPRLAGWELLAVIEPVTGTDESIVARVPGAGDFLDLSVYRKGGLRCDHCDTIRKRTETFVVRHVEERRVMVVGRNCLADFLGGQSPAAILATLELRALMAACGADDEGAGFGGGRSTQLTTPMEWVAQVAAIVRTEGWMSATRARALSEASVTAMPTPSTADKARRALWPTFGFGGNADANRELTEWLAKVAPCGEDEARACAALGWASNLTPGEIAASDGDYLYNLSTIAKATILEPGRQTAILASILSAHARATGTAINGVELPTRRDKAASQHVAAVGAKILITVTVEKQIRCDGNYGVTTLHLMRDAAGNRLTWNSSGEVLGEGWRGVLAATVKGHEVYRDEKSTRLTRCNSYVGPQEIPEGSTWAALATSKPARKPRAPKLAIPVDPATEIPEYARLNADDAREGAAPGCGHVQCASGGDVDPGCMNPSWSE